MKKREQRLSIALKALLEFDRGVGRVRCPHNMLLVEAFDRGMGFVQVPAFQPIHFHRLKDGDKQVLYRKDKRLEFSVPWVTPQIVVEIADEMDETFLLTAGHRVIPRVEIRDEDPRILRQHLVHQGGV